MWGYYLINLRFCRNLSNIHVLLHLVFFLCFFLNLFKYCHIIEINASNQAWTKKYISLKLPFSFQYLMKEYKLVSTVVSFIFIKHMCFIIFRWFQYFNMQMNFVNNFRTTDIVYKESWRTFLTRAAYLFIRCKLINSLQQFSQIPGKSMRWISRCLQRWIAIFFAFFRTDCDSFLFTILWKLSQAVRIRDRKRKKKRKKECLMQIIFLMRLVDSFSRRSYKKR